jgi:hypothetical protein
MSDVARLPALDTGDGLLIDAGVKRELRLRQFLTFARLFHCHGAKILV